MANTDREIARWSKGTPILLRYVHGGFVRYAIPVTVVDDSDRQVVLYLAEGTPLRWTTGLRALNLPIAAPESRHWHSTNVLMLVEPNAGHSTWLMWSATTGAFQGWYVNLQRSLSRMKLGFDTWDQTLDIVVDPQFRWRLKDEDEFAEVQRLGILGPAEAVAVRAETAAVIRRIETRQPPFTQEWQVWKPDPGWRRATLPTDWAKVGPP
jgi:uncharacterized protein DUF402